MIILVEVVDQTDLGLSTSGVADLVRAVMKAENAQGAVVIALVDEAAMIELNDHHRGLSEPTDVLSYCSKDDAPDWPGSCANGGDTPELGEVVVCPMVVRRYADEGKHGLDRQLGWTIVHGTLHLLGYDHERDDGEMRRRERALLKELDRFVSALSFSAGD